MCILQCFQSLWTTAKLESAPSAGVQPQHLLNNTLLCPLHVCQGSRSFLPSKTGITSFEDPSFPNNSCSDGSLQGMIVSFQDYKDGYRL